jgi:hypothetical protein
VEDIRDDTYNNLDSLGTIVEFAQPFEVEKIGRGLLRFGHVEIETDQCMTKPINSNKKD